VGAFRCVSAKKDKKIGGGAGEGQVLVFTISLVISWHNCLGTYNQPVFPFWAAWVSVTQRHPKRRAGEEGRKLRSGSWSQRHIWTENPFPMSVMCCSCAQRSYDLSKAENTLETIILTECVHNYWILWCVIC